jgi:hypothetical protein
MFNKRVLIDTHIHLLREMTDSTDSWVYNNIQHCRKKVLPDKKAHLEK